MLFESITKLECYSLSSSGAVGSLLGAVSSTSSVVAARPTPIHPKPLSANVVASFRFISLLNIKICKLLSLKLQINQIRVVFSHLKVVGQGSETQLQVCENLNYLIQWFKG